MAESNISARKKNVELSRNKPDGKEKSSSSAAPLGSLKTVLNQSDWKDMLLMILGSIGSLADGSAMALTMLIVSSLMNCYGDASFTLKDVNKFSLAFIYVAVGVGSGAFSDVGFFDTNHGASIASQVVSSISTDTLTIQGVLTEKIANFITNTTLFVTAQLAALYLSWRLAVVAIPAISLLVVAGFVFAKLLGDVGNKIQAAYEVAGGIVEQAVSSIRTVYSYVGEERTVKAYKISLEPTSNHGIKQGLMKGMAIGTIGVSFAVWALQGWNGSTLAMHKKAKRGDVFTAGVYIVYRGLGLGGALINIKYFIEANIAASRIFEMIHRVVDIDSAKEPGKTMSEVKGEVEFRNIDFEYPSRPGSLVLSKFNLKVMACQTVGWLAEVDHENQRCPRCFESSLIGRTTIIVAHRLSALRNADLIAVIQSGKLVESGSYEQLMEKLSGPYSIMVQLQRNFIDDEVTSKAQDTGSSSSVVIDTGLADAEQKDDTSLSQSFSDEKKTNQQQDDNYSSPSLWQLMSMAAPEWKPTLIGFIAALACALIQPLHSLCMAALLAPSQIDPEHSDGIKPEKINGEIEFKQVHFFYPNRQKQMILTGVNLQIDAAKVAAIVGRSGSGKSTIIKLIERFYDTNNPRQHCNAKENATEAEIIEAETIANAHDFISSMEDGYETYCGERGVQLTRGQKQRIALARAILKNPTILLLDEATSSLDVNSEGLVQKALERTMTGRTCLVVAHRLSTIQKADKIAVIDQGRIIEA
ncbi:ABC transporter B family member 15 [Populus alba x Populus x berolinensis]|nr:ABC transporter B family member 15 [Populus alba x Populus x berolinensis]